MNFNDEQSKTSHFHYCEIASFEFVEGKGKESKEDRAIFFNFFALSF